jgi:hypothetical protein
MVGANFPLGPGLARRFVLREANARNSIHERCERKLLALNAKPDLAIRAIQRARIAECRA